MVPEAKLRGTLTVNRRLLQEAFGNQRDILIRDLYPSSSGAAPCLGYVVYLIGMVDHDRLEKHIIRPLVEGQAAGHPVPIRALSPGATAVPTVGDALRVAIRGRVLIQVADSPDVFEVDLSQVPHRSVQSPETETGVSGPREAFTELLVINLTQLRRRLPVPGLRLESHWIGTDGKLEVVLAYVQGRPTQRMLDTVRKRLGKVTQDGLQDTTELVEAVSDQPMSLFPEVAVTERPDIMAHMLMGGRIGVFLENSPRALFVPALFQEFFQSVDDFYEWRPYVVFLRLLRFLAFNLAIPLPALYVAFTTYHVQALPTNLTLSLLAQREGVPLPAPVEAGIMTIVFEILREAGVRLPKAVGPTVSIVGGLVIGEAAIRSGLTSPAMVLVVSLTAVSSFILPSTTMANASTYLRLFLLLLASVFGFFGFMLGYVLALANLAGMTSLGVPYAAPLWPLMFKHWKETFGLSPRPPKGHGAVADPAMTSEAQTYAERGE